MSPQEILIVKETWKNTHVTQAEIEWEMSQLEKEDNN